jgi:hypothetical protein
MKRSPVIGVPLKSRLTLWMVRWGWALALALPLLLVAGDAIARVGGGHSYSGGSRSSGGGRSGGGDGDIIWLLIWLCIEHPVIGIPAVIIFIIFVIIRAKLRSGGGSPQRRIANRPRPVTPKGRSRPQGRPSRAVLKADPNFSEPLFIDFFQLVYARGRRLAHAASTEPLLPYFLPDTLETLASGARQGRTVQDVIFGATRIESVKVGGKWIRVVVWCETNTVEASAEGATVQRLRKERWTLKRKVGVLSPGPERMRALSCPACGSTMEPSTDGRCPNCDTIRTGGEVQWVVAGINVVSDRPLSAPELHLGGGVEPGTNFPTITDPDLPVRYRALVGRHPDWSKADFANRVKVVFSTLQSAWSDQRWEQARAYQTDDLFQIHRFWMERYKRGGLVNRLADVKILKVEMAKIDQDAWYESITVRVWASMHDWTEQISDGKVVGGSKTESRTFTEYWTFIRAVGAESREAAHDLAHCPSCGGPLDQVSMAGVCGYCDSKITGGDFDWVLSRIEQDDAYAG